MSKANIIIDGEGVTVTFNSVAIADIVQVSFGFFGERDEINLTTIDATKYDVSLLGDLMNIEDVVITKKSDPAADLAISTANATLVIAYKVGKNTAKTITYYAQRKSISNSEIERSPADGVNVDVTFAITNLNASLAEIGPVIA